MTKLSSSLKMCFSWLILRDIEMKSGMKRREWMGGLPQIDDNTLLEGDTLRGESKGIPCGGENL